MSKKKLTAAVLDRCAYPVASIHARARADALLQAYLTRPAAGELAEKARVVNLLNDLRHTLKECLASWIKDQGAPGIAYRAPRRPVDESPLMAIDFDEVFGWLMGRHVEALQQGESKAA